MAVFRVEKTRDYTVMANHHLKNTELTLKSKGLLSMMLSLPDEWNYTTRGLASICKEGVDAIGASLKELETAGYIVRTQLRDEKGRISDTEYVIYEQPQRQPDTVCPDTENPDMDKPDTVKPSTENPAQLNTYRSKTNLSNTHEANPYPSNLSRRAYYKTKAYGSDEIRYDNAERYRETVKANIEYDHISKRFARERLDEIVDLVVETLCSVKPTICISGDDYPADLVRDKLLKLNSTHIEYVFDCLDRNTTYVRNIKKYLLATLFNAPSTIDSYYAALVNHDMYGDGSRGR
ncbi:hypothetical protein SDC9_63654 [bioreactor metagenome]|uniref:DUF6017 domain-containing protein n=1 Tax=bioreactor metagenome TaxID=1076179 RepID=A0A644XM46_9ZZZZ